MKKTVSLKPDFVEAYNNMGATLQEQDKLEQAIKAFNKACTIKPDFAEAFKNIGNVFQNKVKLMKRWRICQQVSIKPDYMEVQSI